MKCANVSTIELEPPSLNDSRAASARSCDTLGHGPKWLSRRIRLQEVALALVATPTDDLSVIAADFGYSDQSHLARDFRFATGLVPDAYRRTASDLAARTKRRPEAVG